MGNDDKAFLQLRPDGVWAYGSPWTGKHGIGTNISVPLKGICFVERDTKNRIDKMPLADAATRIMKQILIPKDALGAINTFELVDKMLNNVNCWILGCNISIDAAEVAYGAMSGGKYEN